MNRREPSRTGRLVLILVGGVVAVLVAWIAAQVQEGGGDSIGNNPRLGSVIRT